MEGKTRRRTGCSIRYKASAVLPALQRSVGLKRELWRKAKLSEFQSIFVLILTYGHESRELMTERVRSQMQASEMKFFRKIKGVTMFKHRKTAIHESLKIESLLLRIERSQLRRFDHLGRMPTNGFTSKLYVLK